MFAITNFIFIMLNIMLMIFGLVTLGASSYLHQHNSSDCQKVLESPFLVIGVFVLIMALIGLMGSVWRVTIFLWMYSFVSFMLVVGLMAYMVFTILVTNKGLGKALSGFGYEEYRLGDYSNWLRNHFQQGKNWDDIKSCMIDAEICWRLGNNYVNQEASDFYNQKLNSVQSGCCKPPRYCGFEFKNATFWIVPKSGPAVEDSDCRTWSNSQEKLCYECNSCKRGVLENIRNEWRSLAIMNACLLAFVILVYSTSCCTRRNLQCHSPYYKNYFP